MSTQTPDYLSNPRSQELRDICLHMLAAFEALLYGPEHMKLQAHAQLEHYNGQLIELGITTGMKAGLSQEAYRDPVTAAEYLAGQLVEELGHISLSESQVKRSVEEWSEAEQEGVHLLSTHNLPDNVHQFAIHQQVITTVAHFFGRSQQEREEREWQ